MCQGKRQKEEVDALTLLENATQALPQLGYAERRKSERRVLLSLLSSTFPMCPGLW